MSRNRLEAFSDGVLAVSITLLVLDIRVPPPEAHANLSHQLARQWPIYAAYVTSFITIGIIWINHHVMIGRLRKPNHAVLIMNLLLLLCIGVLPFATSLMASYVKQGRGQHLAAAIYGGCFLAMSISFAILNRYILLGRPQLLAHQLSPEHRRRILYRNVTGLIPYLIATALAAVSAYATLVICAAIAVFYALPVASGAGESE